MALASIGMTVASTVMAGNESLPKERLTRPRLAIQAKIIGYTKIAHADLLLYKVTRCSETQSPKRLELWETKVYIQPFVRPVILELLNVIRETENDDLTGVMQRLVCTYSDDVIPIAVDMMNHLAHTFEHVISSESADSNEDKAITALGILNTMETILNVMEDKKEIIIELEGIVLRVIAIILNQNIMDFYEEVLSLIYSLTSSQISQHMWEVFHMIYQMFQKDGIDYFTDMMPSLHNYVTVDTNAFLSNPQCMEIIFEMCKKVLTEDVGEDAECHAAKLLEVTILQCLGKIDQAVPLFVELVLQRLTREVQTSELRTMCLQVVIAAAYYNLPLLLQTMGTLQMPNVSGSILSQFLKQWLHDADCFLGLHDRKLSVLGLCSLINMPGNRPPEVTEVANQLLPASLLIFQGLRRAYASRALEDNSDDEEEEEEGVDDPDILESDEDEVDEESKQYLEKLEKADKDDDSDAEYTDDGAEETALESYQTVLDEEHCPVDEYLVFKTVLGNMQQMDLVWYNALIGNLTPDQVKELDDVFRLADQRKAAADSKRIEEGGGYVFTQRQVPTTFNFGGQIA